MAYRIYPTQKHETNLSKWVGRFHGQFRQSLRGRIHQLFRAETEDSTIKDTLQLLSERFGHLLQMLNSEATSWAVPQK